MEGPLASLRSVLRSLTAHRQPSLLSEKAAMCQQDEKQRQDWREQYRQQEIADKAGLACMTHPADNQTQRDVEYQPHRRRLLANCRNISRPRRGIERREAPADAHRTLSGDRWRRRPFLTWLTYPLCLAV